MRTEPTRPPEGPAAWRVEASPSWLQGGSPAERAATARVWATTEALVQAELAAAELAEARAPSAEVQGYAARIVHDDTADLQALRGVARARAIDVDAPEVQRDPRFTADRRAADEGLARLRSLTGEAFEAAYLAAQPASLADLGALGEQGERAATDVDEGNVLRTIAQQARERAGRVEALIPEPCGGPRPASAPPAPGGRR